MLIVTVEFYIQEDKTCHLKRFMRNEENTVTKDLSLIIRQ